MHPEADRSAPEIGADESSASAFDDSEEERRRADEDRRNAAMFTEELEKTDSEREHERLDREAFGTALELRGENDLDALDGKIRHLNQRVDELEKQRAGMDEGSSLAAELDKDLARFTGLLEAATARRAELVNAADADDDLEFKL